MSAEKILVFSDSHGSTLVMKAILEAPPEGLTAVFHLGDGAEDAERIMCHYPMYAFIGVKGNCDGFSCDKPETVITQRGGVKFMLTHGHRYSVKSSLSHAAITAVKDGADLLLYGHTHVADDRITDTSKGKVRAINPGSVRSGEYAVITIDNGNINCELLRYTSS